MDNNQWLDDTELFPLNEFVDIENKESSQKSTDISPPLSHLPNENLFGMDDSINFELIPPAKQDIPSIKVDPVSKKRGFRLSIDTSNASSNVSATGTSLTAGLTNLSFFPSNMSINNARPIKTPTSIQLSKKNAPVVANTFSLPASAVNTPIDFGTRSQTEDNILAQSSDVLMNNLAELVQTNEISQIKNVNMLNDSLADSNYQQIKDTNKSNNLFGLENEEGFNFSNELLDVINGSNNSLYEKSDQVGDLGLFNNTSLLTPEMYNQLTTPLSSTNNQLDNGLYQSGDLNNEFFDQIMPLIDSQIRSPLNPARSRSNSMFVSSNRQNMHTNVKPNNEKQTMNIAVIIPKWNVPESAPKTASPQKSLLWELEFHDVTVKELKTCLRELDLPTNGNKNDLIARIKEEREKQFMHMESDEVRKKKTKI